MQIAPYPWKGDLVQQENCNNGNGQYILDAKAIVKQAPELKASVITGELTLPEAMTLAKLPVERRIKAMEMITKGKVKTPKGAVLELKKAEAEAQILISPSRPRIIQASWEAWLPQQQLCDLLFTDPPYSTDVEDKERASRKRRKHPHEPMA